MSILGNTEIIYNNDFSSAVSALEAIFEVSQPLLIKTPARVEYKCNTEKFALDAVLDHYKNTDISTYPIKPLQPYKFYKTWLISYGSHDIHIKNMNSLMTSALLTQAFDVMIPYKPNSIDPEYYQAHKEILSLSRGTGYWLWKPYIIEKTLAMMPENDVLFYVDNSAIFRKKLPELLKLIEKEDIVLFSTDHTNRVYMKRAVIDKIMDGDQSIRNKTQLEGNFILLRNNAMVRNFAHQWLKYCEDPLLLTDIPNFKEHHHDQAVLTAVYYKNNISINHNYSLFKREEAAVVTHRRSDSCSVMDLTFQKETAKDQISQTKKQLAKKFTGCQYSVENCLYSLTWKNI